MDNFNVLKNKIIFHKYKIEKILGRGSFGCVFQGKNLQTSSNVALKFETRSAKVQLLKNEAEILYNLKGFGIPDIISFGYIKNYSVMIQELLGANLLHLNSNSVYDIKDICMIGIQIMDRIEFVHSKYLIHRDIKPENFVAGYNNNSTIYIIDFGLAQKFKSSRTGKHVKFTISGKMFGTVRYASYNASRGVQQSRRDDLESIGYMLLFLLKGNLPWKGINLREKNMYKKYREMLSLKKNIPMNKLCSGLPPEIGEYIKYTKKLLFEQDPDYEYLRNLFRAILKRNQPKNDFKFSWIKKTKNFQKSSDSSDEIQKKILMSNIRKRKDSPQNRIYQKVKKSLENNLKEAKSQLDKDNIIIIDNKITKREKSSYEKKYDKHFKNDTEIENEDNSNNVFYNFDIGELGGKSCLSELQTNNYKDKNGFKKGVKNDNVKTNLNIKCNLFRMNNITITPIKNHKLNISIDFVKKSEEKNNRKIIHSLSETLKKKEQDNIQYSKNDKKRIEICNTIYRYYINKFKKLIEPSPIIYNYKNEQRKKIIIEPRKNEDKMRKNYENLDESFSFKNIQIDNKLFISNICVKNDIKNKNLGAKNLIRTKKDININSDNIQKTPKNGIKKDINIIINNNLSNISKNNLTNEINCMLKRNYSNSPNARLAKSISPYKARSKNIQDNIIFSDSNSKLEKFSKANNLKLYHYKRLYQSDTNILAKLNHQKYSSMNINENKNNLMNNISCRLSKRIVKYKPIVSNKEKIQIINTIINNKDNKTLSSINKFVSNTQSNNVAKHGNIKIINLGNKNKFLHHCQNYPNNAIMNQKKKLIANKIKHIKLISMNDIYKNNLNQTQEKMKIGNISQVGDKYRGIRNIYSNSCNNIHDKNNNRKIMMNSNISKRNNSRDIEATCGVFDNIFLQKYGTNLKKN